MRGAARAEERGLRRARREGGEELWGAERRRGCATAEQYGIRPTSDPPPRCCDLAISKCKPGRQLPRWESGNSFWEEKNALSWLSNVTPNVLETIPCWMTSDK